MNSVAARLSVISITLTLLIAGIAFIPSSSADTEPEYGQYGATFDLDYDRLDSMVQYVSGKTIAQWMQDLVNKMEGYNIEETPQIHFQSEFSITRDTVLDGSDYTMTDHVSGWINAKFDGEATGCFPDAGTYKPNEGETNAEFLKRVFTEECTGGDKDIYIHSDLKVYLDAELISNVNMRTGYLNDSYLAIKFAIYEDTDRNISFEYNLDDNDDIEYLTFGYDTYDGHSNLFTDFEISFDIDDMPMIRSGSWTVYPSITEHINKSVISSDLAGSLWLKVTGMSGDVEINAKLPALILELLGSGGRMMDLVDTIKSLTGKELSDLTFMDVLDASEYIDDHGYWYCKLDSRKADGNHYYLPKDGYVMRLSDVIDDLPENIIKEDVQEKLVEFLKTVDWGNIDVKDISGSPSTQVKCEQIRVYVDQKIVEDNEESYPIPTVYAVVAGAGVLISLAVIFLMRRHRI